MAVTITRTAWIDDDGSGTTGTVINNSEKTALYNQIDGALAKVAGLADSNTFTQDQTITKAIPRLIMVDTAQPVDTRRFQVAVANQVLSVFALNDAATVVASTPLTLTRAGSAVIGADIYEKGRATPMGHWVNVPYSAGNFASNTGLWTVEAADVGINQYTLIGKTLIWELQLLSTSVPTVANYLYAFLPVGSIQAIGPTRAASAVNNGAISDAQTVQVGAGFVAFGLVSGANWAISVNATSISATMIISLV